MLHSLSLREREALSGVVANGLLLSIVLPVCLLTGSLLPVLYLGAPLMLSYGLFAALDHHRVKAAGKIAYDERDQLIDAKALRLALDAGAVTMGLLLLAVIYYYPMTNATMLIPFPVLAGCMFVPIFVGSTTWALAVLFHSPLGNYFRADS